MSNKVTFRVFLKGQGIPTNYLSPEECLEYICLNYEKIESIDKCDESGLSLRHMRFKEEKELESFIEDILRTYLKTSSLIALEFKKIPKLFQHFVYVFSSKY